MTQVIESHLPKPPTSTYQRFSGQTYEPPLPEDADPQASSAVSMAFSVLCQEIKSYSVMGKQAGEFKGIKGIAGASTGNLLAEIIHVLLLN